MDSGAEERVYPKEWGSQFGLKEVACKLKFRNASGGNIEHYGQRNVMATAPF